MRGDEHWIRIAQDYKVVPVPQQTLIVVLLLSSPAQQNPQLFHQLLGVKGGFALGERRELDLVADLQGYPLAFS